MHPTTRRDFALTLAAAPLVGGSSQAAPEPAPESSEQSLLNLIHGRFGKQWNAKQLAAVRRGISRSFARADAVRKVELHNGDDPAFAFRADLP